MLHGPGQTAIEKALVICISSGLSGTYNMVRLVCQEYQGMETFVLDTRNISFGSGVFALLAAHWIAGGMDWQDLQIRLVQRLEDSKVFFCVDTLEYLRKGGRLGLVAAIVGTALKLKPIISCNEAGRLLHRREGFGAGKVPGPDAESGRGLCRLKRRLSGSPVERRRPQGSPGAAAPAAGEDPVQRAPG